MIRFEEAYKIVIDSAVKATIEEVDFNNSLNRILAEDIKSDMDMPPFDKSAMDGFACRQEDIKNELEIIETIPAGKVPAKEIKKNQCSKIMTGAMVPQGADCVLMVEFTEEISKNKIRYTKEKSSTNICYTGEDIKTAKIVLKKGTQIKPQHIAVLASVGAVKPKVYTRPKVGVISTGDEIIEPENKPGLSQIRNSNAYQLLAQITQAGAEAEYVGKAADNKKSTFDTISKALKNNDIVLLTGGVSMGEFDHVPEIMNQLGIKIHFEQIAVKPGKPTTFGTIDDKFIFGLPGNPVSSFIQFEILVKPLICKIMNCKHQAKEINLPMGIDYKRKKAERMAWFPVNIKNGIVVPSNYHGSAHIHALENADALTFIPIGQKIIKKGELVHVRPI
ncbi:MAG: gephyrin-like molybdotransferase Glp [Bacteroidota bacterium]|nr:gephyrin-like molybdotransferase Glp [Bacteroidota bacterium]